MKIEIKCRFAQKVLFEHDCKDNTIKKTVEEAVKCRSDLSWSNLRGSDLSGSDLSGSDLSGSDLCGSDLSRSDLRGSDLSGSDLRWSNLRESDLSWSDLSGSDLRWSDLRGSDLSGSNLKWSNLRESDLRESDLSGSNLRWSNLSGSNLNNLKSISISDHCLLSQILLNSAETTKQREWAGLVRISLDWCWDDFLNNMSKPCIKWCVSILSKWPEFKEMYKEKKAGNQ